MQRIQLLLLILAGSLLSSCCCTQPQPSSPPVALFNGREVSAWEAVLAKPGVPKEAVWSVRDGLLICQGDPLGYLATRESYTSFRLIVEWRWAPGKTPGNSGVLMRINGAPRGLPRCLEAQLKSGDAGDLYGFHGMTLDGDSARRLEIKGHELGGDFVGVKKMQGNEKPPGEWNRYEIVLDGPRLTVSVNGRKVNEAVRCEVRPGPIGLQSEGGEIHFRKVELQDLGGGAPARPQP